MPGNLVAWPSAVEIFYDESKAARDVMDQLLIRYRTNTTAVLALATGAATFFGFSNKSEGAVLRPRAPCSTPSLPYLLPQSIGQSHGE